MGRLRFDAMVVRDTAHVVVSEGSCSVVFIKADTGEQEQIDCVFNEEAFAAPGIYDDGLNRETRAATAFFSQADVELILANRASGEIRPGDKIKTTFGTIETVWTVTSAPRYDGHGGVYANLTQDRITKSGGPGVRRQQ
jgi:hypothetical protein